MITILSLDTTSKFSSIAISVDTQIQFEHNFLIHNNLSVGLLPAIQFILQQSGIELADIDLFGITTGPGFFTGIRVGLSTLKGLLFEKQKPIVAVNTLKVLAYKHKEAEKTIIPMIDAKRREVYAAAYRFLTADIEELSPPQNLPVDGAANFLSAYNHPKVVGNGPDMYPDIFDGLFKGKERIERSPFLASEVCKVAYEEFHRGRSINDLQRLLPVYLRKPDAELSMSLKGK